MAKRTKRVTVKGIIDVEKGIITEYIKDEGEVNHVIDKLLLPFEDEENVTFTLSVDEEIVAD